MCRYAVLSTSRTLDKWVEAGGMSSVYTQMEPAFKQIAMDIPRSLCVFEGEKQALERVSSSAHRRVCTRLNGPDAVAGCCLVLCQVLRALALFRPSTG